MKYAKLFHQAIIPGQYPYKSQFDSCVDVNVDQYGFKSYLKSIDP